MSLLWRLFHWKRPAPPEGVSWDEWSKVCDQAEGKKRPSGRPVQPGYYGTIKSRPKPQSDYLAENERIVREMEEAEIARRVEKEQEAVAYRLAVQADQEIEQLIITHRLELTPEQKREMKTLRANVLALQYCEDRRVEMVRDARLHGQLGDMMGVLERSLEVSQAMAQRPTVAGSLFELWQKHPFLVGYLGADLVYKAKDALKDR